MRAKAVDFSGRAGFAEDVNRKGIEIGLFGTAIANSSAHAFDNEFPLSIFDIDTRSHFCREVCRLFELGREEPAPVDERHIGVDDLNGSRLKIVTLTDRTLRTPIAAL